MAEPAAPPSRRDRRRQAARSRRLRPAHFDDLGLRRALSDRMLPALVAAMAFLAALALAGFVAAGALGTRWQRGAGAALTVQVPQPGAPASAAGATRRDAVLALLRATSGIADIHPLGEGELADLLRPWLGTGSDAMTVPLPAVIELHLAAPADTSGPDPASLRARLAAAAPGTLLEDQNQWADRLAALARSLRLSTGLALLVVAAVAVAVVAAATRSGLVARRTAIEIVHGLGATDGYIAGRFARRATTLAVAGGLAGALAALPVLLELAVLAAPFAGAPPDPAAAEQGLPASAALLAQSLPPALWFTLPLLPAITSAIGWLTAQATVRRWLRRLA